MSITTAMIRQLREATGAGPLDCKNALIAHGGDLEQATEYLLARGMARATQKAGRETGDGLVVVHEAGDTICAVQVDCETDFVARTPAFQAFVHRVAEQILADASLTDAESLLAADFIDTPGKATATVIQELIAKLGENIALSRVARYTDDGQGVLEGYVHAGAIEGYGPREGRIGVLVELSAANAAVLDNGALGALAHDLALHIAGAGPRYLAPEDIPEDVIQEKRAELATQLARENKPESIQAKIVEGRLNKFYQEVCLLAQAFIKDENISIGALLQQKGREFGTPVTVRRFARLEVGC